jgi:hypothetical protein
MLSVIIKNVVHIAYFIDCRYIVTITPVMLSAVILSVIIQYNMLSFTNKPVMLGVIILIVAIQPIILTASPLC